MQIQKICKPTKATQLILIGHFVIEGLWSFLMDFYFYFIFMVIFSGLPVQFDTAPYFQRSCQ